MKDAVIIEVEREAYTISQCEETMTVGQLINFLRTFDEDIPIYFSHDGGYSFGTLNEMNIDYRYDLDKEEDEED